MREKHEQPGTHGVGMSREAGDNPERRGARSLPEQQTEVRAGSHGRAFGNQSTRDIEREPVGGIVEYRRLDPDAFEHRRGIEPALPEQQRDAHQGRNRYVLGGMAQAAYGQAIRHLDFFIGRLVRGT